MANGTFTDAALLNLQRDINTVLGDDNSVTRHDLGYKPNTGLALLNNQTNIIQEVKESGKDYTVDIIWLQEDGTAAVTNPDITVCEPTGEQLGAYKESKTILSTDGAEVTLEHDFGIMKGLYASDEEARKIIILKGMKILSKKFNDDCYSFLGANIGTSQYAPETFTPSANNGSGIQIGASDFTGDIIIPELANSAMVNRLGNYFLIGGAFWAAKYDYAVTKGADDNGRGSSSFFNRERWNFDVEKFAADAKRPLYQVSPKAYMSIIKNRHAPGVRALPDDKSAYMLPNPYLPGTFVDVLEQRTCSATDASEVRIAWTFRVNYKNFLNPKSVITGEATNTGIIKFRLT